MLKIEFYCNFLQLKMETPYAIQVESDNIKAILQLLDDNNFIDKIKLQTVLGDEFSSEEIMKILGNKIDRCFCFQEAIGKCVICSLFMFHFHSIKCKFCRKLVCFRDLTLSFIFNTHSGDECCKNCGEKSEKELLSSL
jgi:hypothetical protein